MYPILARTRTSLLSPPPLDDPSILGAGRAALILLPKDPQTCLRLAYQQLHAVPFREVKTCWRRLYTDSALWVVVEVVAEHLEKRGEDESDEKWVDRVVKELDMALILTGAVGREELVGEWFDVLEEVLGSQADESSARPAKRRKVDSEQLPDTFPEDIRRKPVPKCPIARSRELSLSAFQAKVSNPQTQTPLIIEGAIDHWPAFEDSRAWKKPHYLLRKTLDGRRLVPVEIGRSYTDAGWAQKILSFRQFMQTYMLETADAHTDPHPAEHPSDDTPSSHLNAQKGYLAQHDLFAQIPSLRADIAVPDFCYTAPAPPLSNPSHVKDVQELADPLLNAWFGPADTISPLHTDPYHNILAQVVGYKYVRLYAPAETPRLYPRGTEADGVDMSNTSCVDLEGAMEAWPEISCWGHRDGGGGDEGEEQQVRELYGGFREARYVEGVLGPGECLYVPVGWWHYVRSLTASFSVSFWWN
ncbi:hypothetical protein SLS60_010372 [Paraconiothyrium brasiliense]|uniref:JmjC domain-containing protein n=1 Tax=Paraconiothyrium brasiliense TaxID=300254 RepID=A0ABR3QR33_9PLEO